MNGRDLIREKHICPSHTNHSTPPLIEYGTILTIRYAYKIPRSGEMQKLCPPSPPSPWASGCVPDFLPDFPLLL